MALINYVLRSLGGRSNTVKQRSAIGAPVTHHTSFSSPPTPIHRIHIKPSSPKDSHQKRAREDDINAPPDHTLKRTRTSGPPIQKTIKEARIEFWNENGIWPTDKQEAIMDRVRDLIMRVPAKDRSAANAPTPP